MLNFIFQGTLCNPLNKIHLIFAPNLQCDMEILPHFEYTLLGDRARIIKTPPNQQFNEGIKNITKPGVQCVCGVEGILKGSKTGGL